MIKTYRHGLSYVATFSNQSLVFLNDPFQNLYMGHSVRLYGNFSILSGSDGWGLFKGPFEWSLLFWVVNPADGRVTKDEVRATFAVSTCSLWLGELRTGANHSTMMHPCV